MTRKILSLVIITMAGLMASSCRQQPTAVKNDGAISPPVWDWATTGAYGTTDPEYDAAMFRVDTERMATHAWWNQPSMVEALELQPGQRSEMDKVMGAYLSKWAPMGAKRAQGRERIIEAVKARDFDSARRIADDSAWAAAYFQGSPIRLKVEIFALLSDEQLKRVVEEQPFLLNSKWVKSTSLKAE